MDDCRRLCYLDYPACGAFSFDSRNKECKLKDKATVAARSSNVDYISGLISCPWGN